MNNELGLLHVWAQGDWVTRSVFAALLLMSLASWIVILMKALGVVQAKRQAARVEGFWHSADMAEGLGKLGDDDANPFRQLAVEGREAAAHHRAQAQNTINRWGTGVNWTDFHHNGKWHNTY